MQFYAADAIDASAPRSRARSKRVHLQTGKVSVDRAWRAWRLTVENASPGIADRRVDESWCPRLCYGSARPSEAVGGGRGVYPLVRAALISLDKHHGEKAHHASKILHDAVREIELAIHLHRKHHAKNALVPAKT